MLGTARACGRDTTLAPRFLQSELANAGTAFHIFHFNQYLLSIHCDQGFFHVLGVHQQTKDPYPCGTHILVGKAGHELINAIEKKKRKWAGDGVCGRRLQYEMGVRVSLPKVIFGVPGRLCQ